MSDDTKPWVPFQQIYETELVRFRARGPALRAAINQLRERPYRYLDRDGSQHTNDLADDFLRAARFSPEEGSAICRVTYINGPNHSRRVPHWEAYAIEVEARDQAAPQPSRRPSKNVAREIVGQLRKDGREFETCAGLAGEVAARMERLAKSDKRVRPLKKLTLQTRLPEWGLWPL